MICLPAQLLGFATVMLPAFGVMIGILIAGRR